MKIPRAYKTELDPNEEQRTLLLKHAGAARFAWNWGLARRMEEYQTTGRSSNAIEQHRQLNARKATEFPWLYEVSKCAPQEALRDLDRAFAHFYRRVQQKKAGQFQGEVGFPKFKSKRKGVGSFRLTGSIQVKPDRIKLPRLGWIRLKERDYLPTDGFRIRSVTVSERAGRWFVSLQGEEEVEVAQATGPAIGVDLGLKSLAVCSDGRRFENPRALQQAQRKLTRLQREWARRQKGSRNREKTRRRIARQHYRVANLRNESLHQATSAMVAKTKPPEHRPAVVVVEDLNVLGMLKNGCLSRAIADVGMGEFRRQLEYKAAWSGVEVVAADQFFPSSKQCSGCRTVKEDLSLSERTYHCEVCGLVLDRDLNASLNLQRLAPTGSSSGSDACGEERWQPSGSAPRGSRNR